MEPITSSMEMMQRRASLEARLHGLTQRLNADEEALETPERCAHILASAELYRLATILYLQRVYPLKDDEKFKKLHHEQAFHVLGRLKVPTGPWPLFVIACESESDEHRIQILQALEKMDNVRKIGNVHVMRTIIEGIWKQKDLRNTESSTQPIKWWSTVYSDTAVPWFI